MKKINLMVLLAISAAGLSVALAAYSDDSFRASAKDYVNSKHCCSNDNSSDMNKIASLSAIKRQKQAPVMPEYLPYMFLFEHLANVKDKTSVINEFQAKSKLSDTQFLKLIQLAVQYKESVSVLDQQAQVIIDDFHKQYPQGSLPEGTAPPAPPQSLVDLQNKRNETALRYRDLFKTELGDAAFTEFQKFVASEITSKIQGDKVTVKDFPNIAAEGGEQK